MSFWTRHIPDPRGPRALCGVVGRTRLGCAGLLSPLTVGVRRRLSPRGGARVERPGTRGRYTVQCRDLQTEARDRGRDAPDGTVAPNPQKAACFPGVPSLDEPVSIDRRPRGGLPARARAAMGRALLGFSADQPVRHALPVKKNFGGAVDGGARRSRSGLVAGPRRSRFGLAGDGSDITEHKSEDNTGTGEYNKIATHAMTAGGLTTHGGDDGYENHRSV